MAIEIEPRLQSSTHPGHGPPIFLLLKLLFLFLFFESNLTNFLCVVGMYALRERRQHVTQEDFEFAVAKVCLILFLSLLSSFSHPSWLMMELWYRSSRRTKRGIRPSTSCSRSFVVLYFVQMCFFWVTLSELFGERFLEGLVWLCSPAWDLMFWLMSAIYAQ